MKNLELNEFGLQEMNTVELNEINGGNGWVDLGWMILRDVLEGAWVAGNAICDAASARAASDGHVAYADIGHR